MVQCLNDDIGLYHIHSLRKILFLRLQMFIPLLLILFVFKYFCVAEHADVSYFTCLKTSFCDCPSSFQVCKHLDFLRKFIANDRWQGEKTCSVKRPTPLPQLTAKPQANSQVDFWEMFQNALAKLSSIQRDSLSADQLTALASGANNLVQVALTGVRQPKMYERKRDKAKRALTSASQAKWSYERTRAPIQKQRRGADGRVKEHKRQHKQT